MTVVLRILLAVGMACGVLTPVGGAGAADSRPLSVVFVNPGKTGEVYWDMVAQTMQAAGRKLGVHVEVLTQRTQLPHHAGARARRGRT
ncbi:ABC-type sugar transport system substrate-binding protein [Bradyrhizobium sp. LM2.7]